MDPNMGFSVVKPYGSWTKSWKQTFTWFRHPFHSGWFFGHTPLVTVVSTHLRNDGVRQLGWLFPRYGKKNTCSKPPTSTPMISYGLRKKKQPNKTSVELPELEPSLVDGNSQIFLVPLPLLPAIQRSKMQVIQRYWLRTESTIFSIWNSFSHENHDGVCFFLNQVIEIHVAPSCFAGVLAESVRFAVRFGQAPNETMSAKDQQPEYLVNYQSAMKNHG